MDRRPYALPVYPEYVFQYIQMQSPVNQQLTALSVTRAVPFALIEYILIDFRSRFKHK